MAHGGQHAVTVPAPENLFNAKNVIQILEGMMVKVTEQECNSHNVNAACNCAARITDLLRVHLEAERLKKQRP